MIPVNSRRENRIGMGLSEVQQRRLRLLVGLVLGGNYDAADRCGFSNVRFGFLGAEGCSGCG
jgi:hypothetical protein